MYGLDVDLEADVIGLIKFLEGRRPDGRVVVMPDFIDRFVKLESITQFIEGIREKAALGGGAIHGVEQVMVKGGNAVNTAYALGRLGVETYLITVADRMSSQFLYGVFRDMGWVRVKVVEGRPGYTVALEMSRRGRRVNVMMGYIGDASSFGPESLDGEDWGRVSQADITAVLHWSMNERGTDLAEEVFTKAKEAGGTTFLDPSDISHKHGRVKDLLKRVVEPGLLDILSLNENEVRIVAEVLGQPPFPRDYGVEDILGLLPPLSESLGITLDLHTPLAFCTAKGDRSYLVPTIPVEVLNTTGAGDAWNAADITGFLLDLPPRERLLFANSSAALYISNPRVEPPTFPEITALLKKMGEGSP